MIDQLLKIASEDKSNAEKLAFVDEVLSQNFEFKDELIVEQQELLERVDEAIEKQASMSAGFKQGLGLAGAGIAGMVGTALVNDMYSAAKSALTKGRNFERMVQAEPELKQYPADKVKAYFNTLHEKGGPEMSGDPVLAAAFVKQQLDFHGSSIIDQVNKIVGIRENLHKSQGLGKLDFMSMTKMKPQQE
jgi:hypothetical protein